ncbi:hypothetical protein WMY93_027034 [Mugilogobius chulae]|uniref:Uncharacterized protein n=1 Tax=Mugilogobius chulae TaxID=88201 RepID=A0AAW0MSU0_9GOBI
MSDLQAADRLCQSQLRGTIVGYNIGPYGGPVLELMSDLQAADRVFKSQLRGTILGFNRVNLGLLSPTRKGLPEGCLDTAQPDKVYQRAVWTQPGQKGMCQRAVWHSPDRKGCARGLCGTARSERDVAEGCVAQPGQNVMCLKAVWHSPMTKPKAGHHCPICHKYLNNVSQHIRDFHKVKLPQERKILNDMANGNTQIPAGICPARGCSVRVTHLRQHILRHTDISQATKDHLIFIERKRAALKMLADLRASNPQPEMVSRLDLQQENPDPCQNPSCVLRDEAHDYLLRRVPRKLGAQRGKGAPPGEEEPGEQPSTSRQSSSVILPVEVLSSSDDDDDADDDDDDGKGGGDDADADDDDDDDDDNEDNQGPPPQPKKPQPEKPQPKKPQPKKPQPKKPQPEKPQPSAQLSVQTSEPQPEEPQPSAQPSVQTSEPQPEEPQPSAQPSVQTSEPQPEEPQPSAQPSVQTSEPQPEEPQPSAQPSVQTSEPQPEEPQPSAQPSVQTSEPQPEEPQPSAQPSVQTSEPQPEEPQPSVQPSAQPSESQPSAQPSAQTSEPEMTSGISLSDMCESEEAQAADVKKRKRADKATRKPEEGQQTDESEVVEEPVNPTEPDREGVLRNIEEMAAAHKADREGALGVIWPVIHPEISSLLTGRTRGAQTEDYLQEYMEHIFRPHASSKVQENCVTQSTRAKIFTSYMMMGSPKPHWDWRFMFNIPHLHNFQVVLSAVGFKYNTITGYLHQTMTFVEYLNSHNPPGSRLTADEKQKVYWELKKLNRDLGRTLAAYQLSVKGKKLANLIPRETLASCIKQAGEKMPQLLDDLEEAPPRDRATRFRFLGHLAAYISCIYGHRPCVLTKMTCREVRQAYGNDTTGYLVNVLQHKTVQTYGHAQVYLTKEEYAWCLRWLALLNRTVPSNGYFFNAFGRGPIKNLNGSLGKAWLEMGLGEPVPTFMTIRTAVATYNFQSNRDISQRASLSNFMCHSDKIQEKFYALHKTVQLAQKMRQFSLPSAVKLERTASHQSASHHICSCSSRF